MEACLSYLSLPKCPAGESEMLSDEFANIAHQRQLYCASLVPPPQPRAFLTPCFVQKNNSLHSKRKLQTLHSPGVEQTGLTNRMELGITQNGSVELPLVLATPLAGVPQALYEENGVFATMPVSQRPTFSHPQTTLSINPCTISPSNSLKANFDVRNFNEYIAASLAQLWPSSSNCASSLSETMLQDSTKIGGPGKAPLSKPTKSDQIVSFAGSNRSKEEELEKIGPTVWPGYVKNPLGSSQLIEPDSLAISQLFTQPDENSVEETIDNSQFEQEGKISSDFFFTKRRRYAPHSYEAKLEVQQGFARDTRALDKEGKDFTTSDSEAKSFLIRDLLSSSCQANRKKLGKFVNLFPLFGYRSTRN
ncbi:unnamed protein product [Protopolystoma xenopodis]|uniref:Uncharacterized protein n=1 Tax=Protopolystoma xenopodis TaxID=117903 RepID=A0A3S5BLB4_9PLAT|nr:unnamed protein product [Protopolystoma xenopodis]